MPSRGATGNNPVTRSMITTALANALKPVPFVRAFWEGGAASFARIDEWSDIDLYILVDDRKSKDAFKVAEKTLESLSPIIQTYVPSGGWDGVEQKFYRLRDAGRFAVIDLAVLTPKSNEKFLTPQIHGRNVFFFDKTGVSNENDFDTLAFNKARKARWERLVARFRIFDIQVEKELNRKNSLEALEEYRNITLGTLVELLRIAYAPRHYNFRMRYVHYELPKEVVRKLVRLSYVGDFKDLRGLHAEASAWIEELFRAGYPEKPDGRSGRARGRASRY